MNLSALFALIFGAATLVQTEKAIVDAGGVANSPSVHCGSDNGKPLFARVQVSTDSTFGANAIAPAALTNAVAQAAAEGAQIHAEATPDPHA